MKSEKGASLVAIIVYILAMTIVVGSVAMITRLFYQNVDVYERRADNATEFSKFNASFLEDTQTSGIKVREIQTENENYIEFENGTRYTHIDNSIYRDKVKICSNVKSVSYFIRREYGKTILQVIISLGENGEYEKKLDYILEP